MFTLKSNNLTAFRVVLIAVILFNTFVSSPVAVLGQQFLEVEKTPNSNETNNKDSHNAPELKRPVSRLVEKSSLLQPSLTPQNAFLGGDEWILNGNADSTSVPGAIKLTDNAYVVAGSAWASQQIDLSQDFDKTFNLYFGDNQAGADGIVFVLQGVGTNALGSVGLGQGYEGIQPSIGVEFDTYRNTVLNDPNGSHLALLKNGVVSHSSATETVNSGSLEDGKEHTIRFMWTASTKNLKVREYRPGYYYEYIDHTEDFVQTIFNGNSSVWFGFTAATAAQKNLQYFYPSAITSVQTTFSSYLGMDGNFFCGCGQGAVGGPINTNTGGYDYHTTDISIQTGAGPLTFERSYSSLSLYYDLYTNNLGYGWTHNQDIYLTIGDYDSTNRRQITFKGHTANQYSFIQTSGSSIAVTEPGVFATLEETSSAFILTDKMQGKYEFDLTTGKLNSYTDSTNHTWIYAYDTNGKLDQISADGGSKKLDLDYDSQGRVNLVKVKVNDQTKRSVSYDYDPNGDLDSFTDALQQTWAYEYDLIAVHHMTRVVAPGNVTVEQTEYDGKAWRQKNGEGKLVAELSYSYWDGTASIKDALNHTETHTYNGGGVLESQKNQVGYQQKKRYDPNFRPTAMIDSLDNPTTLKWSKSGVNVEYIKDAAGGETLIDYENTESPNSPTLVVDARGFVTKYLYEDANFPTLPTRIEYPLSFDNGLTYIGTDYDYYPPASGEFAGKIMKVTDALGHQTSYDYQTETWGYTETIMVADGTENELVIINKYDDFGQLIETDGGGVITHNEYDAAGRLTRTIHNADPDDFDPNDFVQNLVSDANIYNVVTQYRYDTRGNQIAVIDTYGTITRTYYDLANRPVTVVQNLVVTGSLEDINTPRESIPGFDPVYPDQNIRTDTEYDDAGNVVNTIDPAGIVTHTDYDQANRPVAVIQNYVGDGSYTPAYPDQNIHTEYEYDANNNVIAVTDTLGVITRTYYDKLNRPETVVQHLTGQDISITTPPNRGSESNIRTDTHYDLAGNVIATVDPRNVTTRTYYDALNRPVAVVQNLIGKLYTDPTLPNPENDCGVEENICSFTYYNEVGNVIATIDPRGIATETEYDEANRPIEVTQNPSGPAGETTQTTIHYDQFGRRDTTTDILGHVTKYEYNDVGQLIKTIVNYYDGQPPVNPDNFNISTEYTYDALGRQLTQKDALGRISKNKYDSLGRVYEAIKNYLDGQPQNQKDASGNQYNIITSFTYDERGNQITVTDTVNKVTRTYYDSLSRPVTVVRNLTGSIVNPTPPERGDPIDTEANLRTDTVYLGNGSVDYTLDEMGEMTDYEYDDLGRLASISDPLSKTTSYGYDANSNRTFVTDAEDIVTNFEYDNLNRLKAVVENYDPDPEAEVDFDTNVRTSYTYDASGNRLSIRDGNSHLEEDEYSTSFTYDSLGRIKKEIDPLDNETVYAYAYDSVGRVVSITDANLKTTVHHYDELGRLHEIDYPDSDPDVTFTYDALGRRISMMTDGQGDTTWDYNNLDLPTSITDPFSAEVKYTYDNAGNLDLLTYPDLSVVDYNYNDVNRLEEVIREQTLIANYEYDAVGRVKTVERANGVETAYNYLDNGWLDEILHSGGTEMAVSYKYEYDDVGNRKKAIESFTHSGAGLAMTVPTGELPVASLPQVEFKNETVAHPIPDSQADSFIVPAVYHLQNQETETPTPENTPTPTVEVSATPTASPTLGTSSTPKASPTPEFTSTPEASSTPEAASTPVVELTPEESIAPTASPTPSATTTPVVSELSKPVQSKGAITVNSTADESDSDLNDGICNTDEGECTLRAAIEQANAKPGKDTIVFDLPTDGSLVIQPLVSLPAISDPVIIDGTTQPGFVGMPIIVLDGSKAGDGSDGLHLMAGESLVRGLVINQFTASGIRVDGPGGNQIEGNYIGTDVTGTVASGNLIGILIDDSAGNQIGGKAPEAYNLVAGNGIGVYLHGENASGNRIEGNTIGTTINGDDALGNDIGVRIQEATDNSIGGEDESEENQIEGNADDLYLREVEVSENEIQIDVLENEAGISTEPALEEEASPKPQVNSQQVDDSIGSSLNVHLVSYELLPASAAKTFVVNSGGDTADANIGDGVCSTSGGNCTLRAAIQEANATADKDTINFNISGSGVRNISPASALPIISQPVNINGTTQPGFDGTPLIRLNGANAGLGVNGLRITAGSSTVQGLVISYFDNAGILLATNGSNVVKGNYIGTNATGANANGNGWVGVYVSNIPDNTIGGTTSAARNLISGNFADGVYINGASATGNLVRGNYIGTNAAGTDAIGNVSNGVYIYRASDNIIGGTTASVRNIISGNIGDGVLISGTIASGNDVRGNYIGTNASGTAALGNVGWGVRVDDANSGNVIGGATTGAGNLISGNVSDGILLSYTTGGTIIQGNYIGTDLTGMLDLGNGESGIQVVDSPNNTIGGTTIAASNLISGNHVDGIRITDSGSIGNVIQGNKIGTNINAEPTLGNENYGVLVADVSSNTIGGTTTGTGNMIAGNGQAGIVISQVMSPANGNSIQGNQVWSNGGLGIDLKGSSGVTANDSGDADSGANNLQNFPVLTSVTGGVTTTVTGTLNSAANTAYRVEFFSNAACDPSNYGEGQIYMGFAIVTTNASGNASFAVSLSAGADQFVTATATDPNGNTSEFSACVESEPLTIVYEYDDLYRLTEANYSTGDYYHYTYDAAGNRKTETSLIGGLPSATTYVYKHNNFIDTVNGVHYTYDNKGNLIYDGVTAYGYDSANRLTVLSNNSLGVMQFYYNGLGDRLSQTVNSVTTNYTLDLNSGLTQVLNDGTNTYLYGNGRIAQVGTTTDYFLGDALGSVRQLTNPQGDITLAKSYDPYGTVSQSVGSGESIYAYTGEQMDASGLTYLRARYYSGDMGRFLTRDTWSGDANSPITYNRWQYANANPVTYTDPSGHLACKDVVSSWQAIFKALTLCSPDEESAQGLNPISTTQGLGNSVRCGVGYTALAFGQICVPIVVNESIDNGCDEPLFPGLSMQYQEVESQKSCQKYNDAIRKANNRLLELTTHKRWAQSRLIAVALEEAVRALARRYSWGHLVNYGIDGYDHVAAYEEFRSGLTDDMETWWRYANETNSECEAQQEELASTLRKLSSGLDAIERNLDILRRLSVARLIEKERAYYPAYQPPDEISNLIIRGILR